MWEWQACTLGSAGLPPQEPQEMPLTNHQVREGHQKRHLRKSTCNQHTSLGLSECLINTWEGGATYKANVCHKIRLEHSHH